MDCEVCGSKKATVKARITGALLSVCSGCATTGEVIHEPIMRPTQKHMLPAPIIKPESEELIVLDFAKKISQARQKTGLKQQDIANKINEKVSVISAVETGKRVPDLKLAKKLERFFGITLIETG